MTLRSKYSRGRIASVFIAIAKPHCKSQLLVNCFCAKWLANVTNAYHQQAFSETQMKVNMRYTIAHFYRTPRMWMARRNFSGASLNSRYLCVSLIFKWRNGSACTKSTSYSANRAAYKIVSCTLRFGYARAI